MIQKNLPITIFSLFFASSFFFIPSIQGQSSNITEVGGSDGKGGGEVANLSTYNPIAIQDVRFRVSNLNFVRRFDSIGQGEFLDVILDITNNTTERINFRIFVLAFYETDAVNKQGREWVPYPTWRKYDPDKTNYITYSMAITPKDIPENQIWNENDPDYWRYKNMTNRIKDSAATTEIVYESLPPYWKYLAYLTKYPDQGLPVALYGSTGPSAAEAFDTNYIPPTPEEKKLKIHKTLPLHKYTINYASRKTMLQTHHYIRFRPNYHFFNRIAILFFDESKIGQLDKQGNPIDALVYKKTYNLPKSLKKSN